MESNLKIETLKKVLSHDEVQNQLEKFETDSLFREACNFVIEKQEVSVGMLQRRFRIGFNRSARIVDLMEEAGIISKQEGKEPRKVNCETTEKYNEWKKKKYIKNNIEQYSDVIEKIYSNIKDNNEILEKIGEFNEIKKMIEDTMSLYANKNSLQDKIKVENVNINDFDNVKMYYCSKQDIINSKLEPYKYICKFFNMNLSQKLFSDIDKDINELKSVNIQVLIDKEKEICDLIEKHILNEEEKNLSIFIAYKLGLQKGLDITKEAKKTLCKDIYLLFNEKDFNMLYMNIDNLEAFKQYIENNNNYIKEKKDQRSLMTPQLRGQVLARDNYTCQKCGNSIEKEPNLLLEVDHIIPIAKGGLTVIDNLQTLCWKCNRAKSDK